MSQSSHVPDSIRSVWEKRRRSKRSQVQKQTLSKSHGVLPSRKCKELKNEELSSTTLSSTSIISQSCAVLPSRISSRNSNSRNGLPRGKSYELSNNERSSVSIRSSSLSSIMSKSCSVLPSRMSSRNTDSHSVVPTRRLKGARKENRSSSVTTPLSSTNIMKHTGNVVLPTIRNAETLTYTYDIEHTKFTIAVAYAYVKYQRALELTPNYSSNLGMPSQLRLHVCADLLHRLSVTCDDGEDVRTRTFTRFADVFKPLVVVILESVYVSIPRLLLDGSLPQNDTEYSEHINALRQQPTYVSWAFHLRNRLLDQKQEISKEERSIRKMNSSIQLRIGVLDTAARSWQTVLLVCVFNQWRKNSQKIRQQRRALQYILKRCRLRVRRYHLQSVFRLWRIQSELDVRAKVKVLAQREQKKLVLLGERVRAVRSNIDELTTSIVQKTKQKKDTDENTLRVSKELINVVGNLSFVATQRLSALMSPFLQLCQTTVDAVKNDLDRYFCRDKVVSGRPYEYHDLALLYNYLPATTYAMAPNGESDTILSHAQQCEAVFRSSVPDILLAWMNRHISVYNEAIQHIRNSSRRNSLRRASLRRKTASFSRPSGVDWCQTFKVPSIPPFNVDHVENFSSDIISGEALLRVAFQVAPEDMLRKIAAALCDIDHDSRVRKCLNAIFAFVPTSYTQTELLSAHDIIACAKPDLMVVLLSRMFITCPSVPSTRPPVKSSSMNYHRGASNNEGIGVFGALPESNCMTAPIWEEEPPAIIPDFAKPVCELREKAEEIQSELDALKDMFESYAKMSSMQDVSYVCKRVEDITRVFERQQKNNPNLSDARESAHQIVKLLDSNWKRVVDDDDDEEEDEDAEDQESRTLSCEQSMKVAVCRFPQMIHELTSKTMGVVTPLNFSAVLWSLMQRKVRNFVHHALRQRLIKRVPLVIIDYRAERDFTVFTSLDSKWLEELLPGRVDSETMASMSTILHENYQQLRSIFKTYAADDADSSAATMNLMELTSLARECKIIDRKLTSANLETMFMRVSQLRSKAAELQLSNENTSRRSSTRSQILSQRRSIKAKVEMSHENDELTPVHFVHVLVDIAAHKATCNDSTISKEFHQLLRMHVLRYARQFNGGQSQSLMTQTKYLELFRQHSRKLRRIFTCFATMESVCGESNQVWANTIDIGEFSTMLRCAYMLQPDGMMSSDDVKQVFVNVKQPHSRQQPLMGNSPQQPRHHQSPSVDETTSIADEELDSLEMIYPEFLESTIAVAQYKSPDPFVPLFDRVENFLTTSFMPTLLRVVSHVERKRGQNIGDVLEQLQNRGKKASTNIDGIRNSSVRRRRKGTRRSTKTKQ